MTVDDVRLILERVNESMLEEKTRGELYLGRKKERLRYREKKRGL